MLYADCCPSRTVRWRVVETFELKRSADHRYYFTFRAGNGQAIADSALYETKRSALDAIELLRRHAREAYLDDRTIESGDDSRA